MEVQAFRLRVLGADVLRHAVDVLHQLHGMLEGVGVHPLDEIRLDSRHARAVVADVVDLVGVVDVAHLDLLIGEKRAGDAEGFAHLQQLAGDGGIHGMLVVHKVFLTISIICASRFAHLQNQVNLSMAPSLLPDR